MWYHNKFFKYTIGFILVMLAIWLTYQVSFLFAPVINFAAALFFPLLFAGILYYVLRPLVRILEHYRVPRIIAIMISYIVVFVAMVFLISYVGPILVEQIDVLTALPPEKIETIKNKTEGVLKFFHIDSFSSAEIRNAATSLLNKFYEILSNNIVGAISTITKFAVWLAITPFILYYLLKDDQSITSRWRQLVPVKYQSEAKQFFKEVDLVLSTYITGQLMVAASLGFILFIGYMIIGLHNAFVLAVFATVCITIPIFGSFIAIIPALVVGMADSPWMGLKVIIVMLIAQALESNLISPQILAQRLKIHPLVLMLILLASGLLYGILGLFLATPIYAVVRVAAQHGYKIYNQS